jgi:hypothetical protein
MGARQRGVEGEERGGGGSYVPEAGVQVLNIQYFWLCPQIPFPLYHPIILDSRVTRPASKKHGKVGAKEKRCCILWGYLTHNGTLNVLRGNPETRARHAGQLFACAHLEVLDF